MARVVLVEAAPWDPATGQPVPVRLAGGGRRHYRHKGFADWAAGVVGVPKVAAQLGFDGAGLTDGAIPRFTAIGFSPALASTRARLARLMWARAPVTVSVGDDEADVPAWSVRLAGVVTGYTVQNGSFTFTVADLTAGLVAPLAPGTFAGTGGLEGGSEAEGRSKRRSWGRVCNVEGRLLDKAANVYEFGDPARALAGIAAVKDRGREGELALVGWAGSAAATLAALRAAPAPRGGAAVAPSIACAKWWTATGGPITADLLGEVGAGYTEALGGIAARIAEAAGLPASDLSAVTGWRPGAAGLHVDGGETAAAALNRLLLPALVGWAIAPAGGLDVFPIEFGEPVETLRARDIRRDAAYPPVTRVDLGYRRNHRRHSDAEVSAAVRAEEVVYDDGTPAEVLKPAGPDADSTRNYLETSRYQLDSSDTAREERPRFDPVFWTTDFPLTMMASLVADSASLRLDASFHERGHLAGLIWESEDRLDHPSTAYATDRDYRGCVLKFRLRIEGEVEDLEAVNGPVLTIEGRNERGETSVWYVRLEHARVDEGTSREAIILLDFDRLPGGFAGEDSIFAGDVDRLLITCVPTGFVEGSADPLSTAVEGALVLSEIAVSGTRTTLDCGHGPGGVHDIRMASGYDDTYNVTPARIVRNLELLGYSGEFNEYVGMSHYFRWRWVPAEDRYVVVCEGETLLNKPCRAWHTDLATRLKESGRELILSLSYELLDSFAPSGWRQLSVHGAPALTGWKPPSTLVSPCNAAAMAYLKQVAIEFCDIAAAAGLRVRFQVGEPWYWIDFRTLEPFFYDDDTVAAWTAERGTAPPPIESMGNDLGTAELAFLDWLGSQLADSVLDLHATVRARHPGATSYALVYLPQLLDGRTPQAHRVNLPVELAWPALDVLQLEDYDFLIEGRHDLSATARAAVERKLGYPRARQEYFAGFALKPDKGPIWRASSTALSDARDWGIAPLYIWAYTQVCRDGYVPRIKSAPAPRLADLRDVAVLRAPASDGDTLTWDAATGAWAPRGAMPPAQLPTLTMPWIGYGAGYQGPRYARDATGVVTIEGLVQAPAGTSTTDVVLFTLLPGYRPAERLIFTVWTGGGAARADVHPSGEVVLSQANTAFSSLSGIRFMTTGAEDT